jgi:hypothetical protein
MIETNSPFSIAKVTSLRTSVCRDPLAKILRTWSILR